ncbi:MAG: DEAD/DEAH box helicase family protein [Planctomycetota bacterium]
MNEADTCRKFVTPALQKAGWDEEPHSLAEQRSFTDGRIFPQGAAHRRKPGKRPDYILRYTRDFPLAVVEAKSDEKNQGSGLQEAKDYAEALGLKFAYSTNGPGIVEFDYAAGVERELSAYPTPNELWARYRKSERLSDDGVANALLAPANLTAKKEPRYYQRIAIQRAVGLIRQGRKRVLLTMATGTGKTDVAFQICWNLWSTRWNRAGEHRKPRILYLADRNFLVDGPKARTFAPFGDARHKIEGEAVKSREMYFAIYQAIARDKDRLGLYRDYPRDFFDLVIVDECHRGSASDESNWREILEWFEPAYQLGMTATPQRDENRDTYLYFGNPVYEYSLRQGIDDGFLAPYRVHRVVTRWDATGWRPSQDDLDRFGREIPDEEYQTCDFERRVALRARTKAVARHLTDFLKKTDRFAKTIVFCVDQEHALEMRNALVNLNSDLVREHPDYVCRVTTDEGDVGRGHMERFQDVESRTPVILTTSQLLTTGLDAPTCKNIVLVRVVNSMVEFKQIIGRGTRVREDCGKLWFSILDYTGSATQNFADPDFDGDPTLATKEEIDEHGKVTSEETDVPETAYEDAGTPADPIQEARDGIQDKPEPGRRKIYFDGGQVEIVAHVVYELDADGRQLRTVSLTDYAAERVRTLCTGLDDLRRRWADPEERGGIVDRLEERGIYFPTLADQAGRPDADPFDLLCHLAFNAPIRSRKERADRVKKERRAFFEKFAPEARKILDELLDQYAQHGFGEFSLPAALKIPPVSAHGTVDEIVTLFGGPDKLRTAMTELQGFVYAA